MPANRHPWWVHWRREENAAIRKSLVYYIHQDLWYRVLDDLQEDRGEDWEQIYKYLGWEHHHGFRVRDWGAPFGVRSGGLPLVLVFTFAWLFDVDVATFVPDKRGFFGGATDRLVNVDYRDVCRLSRLEIEAYVEYYLQCPREEVASDELSLKALQQAFCNVSHQYESFREFGDCAQQSRLVIDGLLSSLEGTYG